MISKLIGSAGFLSSGGTIGGDLTIDGDLTVNGGGGFSYSEVLTGDMKITNELNTIALEIQQRGNESALKIDQDVADQSSIYIDSESQTANVIHFLAPATTTAWGIMMDDMDSLTTGGGMQIKSNASSTGTRSLLKIVNDNASATGATGLYVQQDSTGSALTAIGAAGSGSASGSVIKLQTSETTVVDGDYLGRIEFSAPSEASGTDAILAGAAIWAEADDTFAADNNSTELVFGTNTSAAYTERMRIDSSGKVGIGTAAPDTLLHLYSTSASKPILKIENEQGGANPVSIQLLRNTSSPADDDFIGQIDFRSMNDAGTPEEINYAYITGQSTDITDGTEDGELQFYTMKAGTSTNTMTMQSGKVGIGETSPVGFLHISPPSGSAPTMYFEQYTSATDGTLGEISFGNRAVDGQLATISAINDGANDSAYLAFSTEVTSGALAERMRITSTGNVGIGVVPEAWDTFDVIQLGGYASISGQSGTVAGNEAWFASNAYYASGWKYIITDEASAFEPKNGELLFKTAASGSADASISWVQNMKIDANSRISLSNNDASGGASNTIFGYGAGASIASGGTYNAIYGHQAGTDITIGRYTTAIGYRALYTEDVGDESTAVGYGALFSQNSDSDNESTGNTGVGVTAGYYNVTGQNNTYLGYSAGKGASGQSNNNNTAVGANAGEAITTAERSTLVGRFAGGQITSSSNNTLVGYKAGYDITTASNEAVAVGESALENITTATRVTAVGYQAGMVMSTGDSGVGSMVAVGTLALKSTTGKRNTAVGSASGDNITTGIENTLLGADTNVDASGRNGCVIIGYGVTLNTASDNVVEIGNDTNSMTYDLDGGDITVT